MEWGQIRGSLGHLLRATPCGRHRRLVGPDLPRRQAFAEAVRDTAFTHGRLDSDSCRNLDADSGRLVRACADRTVLVGHARNHVLVPAGLDGSAGDRAGTSGIVRQDSAFADVIYENESDSAFIAVSSQPLAGKTLEQWSADYLPIEDYTGTEPVTIDGAAGLIGLGCLQAVVALDNRGYLIWLYRSDNRDWFEEILATVGRCAVWLGSIPARVQLRATNWRRIRPRDHERQFLRGACSGFRRFGPSWRCHRAGDRRRARGSM